jgi:trk system potassium uptake protein TrkA
MLGVKLRDNALILNIPIYQLQKEHPYHIVTIKRQGETIIPGGADILQAGDIVYFMTSKRSLPYIRKITGKEDHSTIRNIMIMGGSRIAMRATQLVSDAMTVKVIESDYNRCHWFTDMVDDNVMVINGDGRDYELLSEEGISEVDAFVALTDNSETNILACLSAKRMGVFKTIAEVENIDYIGMAESLDIGAVINKKKIAASYIYQLLLDADVENVKCLTFANADVAEFVVKENARVTRTLVKDINLPKGATIGGLVRGDEGILVTGDTQIQAGDHVVVFCLTSMIKRIEKYFN